MREDNHLHGKSNLINLYRGIYLTAFGWVLYYRQSKKLQIVSTLNTEGNRTEIFVDNLMIVPV